MRIRSSVSGRSGCSATRAGCRRPWPSGSRRRAKVEPDVQVRSQLACSAKRLPARDALPVVARLAAHAEDARDIHIPLLLWWAVESKVAADPEAVLSLFREPGFWELPIVRGTIEERLMRRFAAAGTRKDLESCARLLALAPGAEHGKILMSGFEAAYAGRSLAGIPPSLADALARFSGQSVTLGLRRGKPEAAAEALAVLSDEQGDKAKQLQYLQVLGEVRVPGAVPVLLKLACNSPDNAQRSAALAALANYDDPVDRERGPQDLRQPLRRRHGRGPEPPGRAEGLGRGVPPGDRREDDRPPDRAPRDRRAARPPERPADRRAGRPPLRRDPAGDLGRAPGPDLPPGRRGPVRPRRPQAGPADLRRPVRPLPHPLRQGGQGRAGPDDVPPGRPGDHAPEHRQPERRGPRGLHQLRRSPRPTAGP